MIESRQDMVCRFLPDGTLTYVNSAYCAYFQRSKAELLGTNFFDLIPPDVHKEARDHIASITPDDPVKVISHPVISPDGRIHWHQWIDCGVFSNDGVLVDLHSVGRDITELRNAVEALREKEAKLKALIDDVLDDTDVGLCILDKDLRSVWNNKALQRFFGYPLADIVGANKRDIIAEQFAPLVEDPHGFKQTVLNAYDSGGSIEGFECHILASDTMAERWLDIRSKPIEGGYFAGGRIEQYTDISHLKLSELALRDSERRFKELADLLPEAIFEMDVDGTLTYANQLAFQYFGYRPEDLGEGYNVIEMVHPDDRARLQTNIGRILAGGMPVINEYTAVRKDGGQFPVWSSSAVIKENDQITGLRGFILDISDHKQKAAELELLKTVVEQVSDAIEITDALGTMKYVNPAFEKVTGYPKEELIGRNPRLLKSGQHAQTTYDKLWQTIKAGRQWRGRLINRRKDGELYHEDIAITPVHNDKREITNYVAIKRDVTEDTRNEERMRHMQKMQALATLAGGIAHDFNNILAGVLGYTELSMDRVSGDPETHEYLSEVVKACMRAKTLIAQILNFSRVEEYECKPYRIHTVIEEALNLLRSTLPSNIDIQRQIASTHMVAIAPTQMHQVIINLCTNAFHAMETTGGQIGVSLTDIELGEKDLLLFPELGPGAYAKLTISDTGHGMNAQTLDRIFDPYFSTKDRSKGSGLGLSMVHGIVRGCGGSIKVASELGHGTTFELYFPVIDGDAQTDADASPDTALPTGTGERILFVDDEVTIVKVAAKMLERLGYTVSAMTDPSEALRLFRANPQEYDLVISDMTMPELMGDQLAIEIKSVRPDMPIIVCTGFSEHMDDERAEALGLDALLLKPVTKSDFAFAIKKVFENP